MFRQAALVACAVTAVLTSVRLLSSVNPQVSRQAALIACLEPTVLAHMDSHLDVRARRPLVPTSSSYLQSYPLSWGNGPAHEGQQTAGRGQLTAIALMHGVNKSRH